VMGHAGATTTAISAALRNARAARPRDFDGAGGAGRVAGMAAKAWREDIVAPGNPLPATL